MYTQNFDARATTVCRRSVAAAAAVRVPVTAKVWWMRDPSVGRSPDSTTPSSPVPADS